MNCRLLSKNDFSQLHQAFCLAFSNNKVDFDLSEEEFDHRLHQKLNIDYELSAGAFDGDELIGFILHSSNIYEGIPTAFNAGTGVIPGFRNQRTGIDLYEFVLPKIIRKSIARVILEVIDTNKNAIHLYEKVGFLFKRSFCCYKMTKPMRFEINVDIEEGTIEDINEDFADYEPSFADSYNQLVVSKEKIMIVKDGQGHVIAYLVFQPHIGRISQLAVARLHRDLDIAQSLVKYAMDESKKPLTIMNIPESEAGFQNFLMKCGFENQVNQFEMELII